MTSRTPEQPSPGARPLVVWRTLALRAGEGVSYRGIAWALGISAALGLIQAAPLLGATPQPGLWGSATLGTAATLGRDGYGAASLADRAAAIFWSLGGAGGLSTWQTLLVFLTAGFFVLSALTLATWVGKLFPKGARGLFIGVLALLTLWSSYQAWNGFSHRTELFADVRLSQPVELSEAVASQPKGAVFATPGAMGYLLLTHPEAIEDLNFGKSTQLSRKPRNWREALRTKGWRAALLAGPVSEYRGLLDHLLTSPDWRLAQVSNQGYLFIREPGAAVASIDPASIHVGSSRDTALYLAQIAERYEAIRRTAEARSISKIAVDGGANDVEVLSHTAALESSRGKWYDAIAYCDRALAIDPNSPYLRLLKASCLLEINQADKAEQAAREVLDRSPDDLYTLFLYARISRALHDAKAESETLEKLIRLTPQEAIPVNYYIFLGQAYAKQGQANLAIGAYRNALARPDIGPELGAEVKRQIESIEQKVGN